MDSMSTISPPAPTFAPLVLHAIPWEMYCQLRSEPANSHVRMTFDRGRLEMMSPSKLHERIASLLTQMIVVWTEEKKIGRQSCGTVTFQREDLIRGLEPDQCFYIQNEAAVRGRDELDLEQDPPPDLVIEVDLTSPSRARLPLYQALGVPEVWVWRGDLLAVHVLDAGRYEVRSVSEALPGFPIPTAVELLRDRHAVDETELILRFREVVRAH
jgi:Uma2 family endonuclease